MSHSMLKVCVAVVTSLDICGCLQALVRQRGFMLSQWLHIGGVKAFADGSLGTRTALFHKVVFVDFTVSS
jgi:predicted amidohydrolase YtcJ